MGLDHAAYVLCSLASPCLSTGYPIYQIRVSSFVHG